MHYTYFKAGKMTEIVSFAQKNSKFFAVKNGMVFFINRLKLETVLAFLCLLGEFNNRFLNVKSGNITSWIRSKKLLNIELLQEISDFVLDYKIKKFF